MRISSIFLIIAAVFHLSVEAQEFGSALLFDGVDDYIDMGNSSTLDIGTAVTYEAWVNPDTTLPGIILNKWVGFL